MAYKTDIEIARDAVKQPIQDIGAKLGIGSDDLLPYGHDKAKVSQAFIDSVQDRPNGKLVLVTGCCGRWHGASCADGRHEPAFHG